MNTSRNCALVTGASKGVGRGIALGLAEAGWSVGINYNGDQAGAEATAARVRELGTSACVLQGDVGDSADVRRMFDEFLESAGRLDLLVNNAGVQTWAPLLELSEDDWDRTIRTNLKGTFLCTQQAAKIMRDAAAGAAPNASAEDDPRNSPSNGCIINIGSGANKGPFPNLADYCASKGGIERFTAVSAVELGPLGIRVNCVAPGAIEVERTREEDPDYAGTWAAVTPVRRVGQVSDVADAVVYLASDQASFINGQTVYVDGGLFSQVPWPY
jgi:NAD(P)-dependent dehydrogenase (short-subunit alcohol dehydrogenase family)